MTLSRRNVILRSCLMLPVAELLAAGEYARQAAGRPAPFSYLDPASAAEIEALAAQIIPSDDGPGAREAGVIYFIDRALATLEKDKQEVYRQGLAETAAERRRLFPDSTSIASLSGPEQIALLKAIEQHEFFEILRAHTILGFVSDPQYGGNRDYAGWKLLGFETAMSYRPPFGYYDAEEHRS